MHFKYRRFLFIFFLSFLLILFISGRTTYNHSFHLVEMGYKLGGEYIDRDYTPASQTYITPSDCSHQCLNEPDFYCESFSVCFNQHSCLLSHRNPDVDGDVNKTELVKETDCAVFSRKMHLLKS